MCCKDFFSVAHHGVLKHTQLEIIPPGVTIMLLFRDYAPENQDYARFCANYVFLLKWPKNANYAHNFDSRRNQSLVTY